MNIQILEFTGDYLKIKKGKRQIFSSGSKASGRTAYLFDDFVIKFGWAGEAELDFWQNAVEEEDKQYFCAVYGHGEFDGDFFLIQERAKEERTEPTARDKQLLKHLCNKYDLSDISFNDGWASYTETHHNIMLTADSIKIFDYETTGDASCDWDSYEDSYDGFW